MPIFRSKFFLASFSLSESNPPLFNEILGIELKLPPCSSLIKIFFGLPFKILILFIEASDLKCLSVREDFKI